jgi:hypothetical protein
MQILKYLLVRESVRYEYMDPVSINESKILSGLWIWKKLNLPPNHIPQHLLIEYSQIFGHLWTVHISTFSTKRTFFKISKWKSKFLQI